MALAEQGHAAMHPHHTARTCLCTEHAQRVSVLVDNKAYFAAAREALLSARQSIFLVGWQFNPAAMLDPLADEPETVGEFLNAIQAERPDLDIRILIWGASYAISAAFRFFPHRAPLFLDERIHFHLDNAHPFGSCHHEKLLVIDDAVAFCSGDDFMPDRWDDRRHETTSFGRRRTRFRRSPPHHGATMIVDGAAAAALGRLARWRWLQATGQQPPTPQATPPSDDPWPRSVEPDLRNVDAAIVRTSPGGNGRPAISNGIAWYLDAIQNARRYIYIENQYITSPTLWEALARRLSEPDGPEIITVIAPHAPSYFDRAVMDAASSAFVAALRQADLHGRYRAYIPYTAEGRPIMVHSKLAVIDDALVRIGSANLNNRSMGFDTECDLALEAAPGRDGDETRSFAHRLVCDLLAHFIGRTAAEFSAAVDERGGLIPAVEALDQFPQRLRRRTPPSTRTFGGLTAAHHLGDPEGPGDSMRPWARRSGPAELPKGRILLSIVAASLALAWRRRRRRRR